MVSIGDVEYVFFITFAGTFIRPDHGVEDLIRNAYPTPWVKTS